MPPARISLTLFHRFSLSFIASGRSSGLHPASSHSCCMYVRAGLPVFARLYVGVHRIISLMSSSLLLQQCPACVVRLTWIVFLMGGRWPYSWCFVGCCRQDLFNKKKNPKHLKCSLTRAKDEIHKRVDSSSLFLSLSLCLCLSVSLSLSLWPPLDDHDIGVEPLI